MIAKGGELLMSQLAELGIKASAKWRGVIKLVLMTSTLIIFAIPVTLLPSAIRRVQPTAEFVFQVVAPSLWNSVSTCRISTPCLYVLLNIVLVTLALISRAPQTSSDDQVHNSAGTLLNNRSINPDQIENIETKPDAGHDADYSNIIIVESKSCNPVQNDLSPATSPADQIQKPAAPVPVVAESRSRSLKDQLKAGSIMTPGAGPAALNAKKSRLRRSTAKLSNLSRESRCCNNSKMISPAAPKTSPPPAQLVVFEICTESVEDYYYMHHHEEVAAMGEGNLNRIKEIQEGRTAVSSSDELYLKAESFIGDFYRQLKMQREDSWNRLCGIYSRSC